jgi:tetratricopeptide (TPR) repeat protein
MRLPVPATARARKRLAVLVYLILGLVTMGCSWVVFVTNRSSLQGLPYADAVAGFVAVSVALYSGMLIVLLASDYRPQRLLRTGVAGLFSAGLAVTLQVIGVRSLHLPAPVAAVGSVVTSVAAFREALRKVGRDQGRTLGSVSKRLADPRAAREMLEAATRVLGSERLDPDERATARINLARALVATSMAEGFPDGLIPATDTLKAVLTGQPPKDWLLVLQAAEELVGAMDVKAAKHGDPTGYPDALELLAKAAKEAPDDAGAMATYHHLVAEYQLTLAGRQSAGHEAEAHADAAIAELRRAIAAVTPVRRLMLAGLYAKLGQLLGDRRKHQEDLEAGIELCRRGQRLARASRRARSLPDLALASLLIDRAWETALSVDESATEPTLEAAAASVRKDLGEATALARRVIRRDPSNRFDGLEESARAQAAWEGLFDEPSRRPAVAAAWREAALASTQEAMASMARVGRAWVDWAEATEEPGWCAEAYQHLMSLVPRAAATRYLPAERDRLLAGVQHRAEEAGYWLASTGRLREAAVALELGRAVSISEVVARERPELPELLARAGRPDLWRRYESAIAQYTGQEGPDAPDPFSTAAQRAWSAYDAVLREVADVEGAEQVVAPADFADLTAAARDGPLVYLAAAERLGYALIVTADGEPRWLPLPSMTRQRVRARVELALGRADRRSVAAILQWLWEDGIADLAEWLPERALVTLVPVGLLSLLPLHGAGGPPAPGVTPADWRYLADRVTVRYALNARTLVRARARAAECDRAGLRLLAVDAPGGDPRWPLAWTGPEIRELDRRWRAGGGAGTVLPGGTRAEVLAALPGHTVWHFACHCQTLPDRILDSSLLLEDGRLRLDDVLALAVSPRRLAVLSACQSHRSGQELPDEAMGLPGALLQVGLAGVVASHWNVDDHSTVFLMARFYELWRGRGLPPSSALAQAQHWLRRATRADLHAFLPQALQPPVDRSPAAWARWADVRPFDHPRHWAPFALTGT